MSILAGGVNVKLIVIHFEDPLKSAWHTDHEDLEYDA